MARKRERKQKQTSEVSEESGQTQATAKIDHIFASSGDGPKKKHGIRRFVSTRNQRIVAVLIVLVVAGAAVFMMVRSDKPPVAKPTGYTSEGIKLQKLTDKQLERELEKLVTRKFYKSAQELINYQDNAQSEPLQLQLATILVNQKKHQEAIQVFQSMEGNNIGQKWKALRNIGQEYEKLKDKQSALTYYQRSLDELNKTDDVPVKSDEIIFLKNDIKRVKG